MAAESVLARIAENPKLPTPPALTLRVLERANKPNCSIADIGKLISVDPAMCGRMLQLVNSSLYGLHRPVTSIERALNLLGLNHVRSLVLSLSLPSLRFNGASSDEVKAYWKSSLTIAIACRELAGLLRWPDADSEMVAGLLCDFGLLLLQESFPEEAARMAVIAPTAWRERQCQLEVECFGVDHAEVGAFFLKRWRLADDLTEPIRFHHRTADAPPAYADRAALLSFASLIAQLHETPDRAGLLTEIVRRSQERYRLGHDQLLDFLESLHGKIQEFAALIEIDLGPRESFAELLTKSTENLTRLAVEASMDTLRIHEEKTVVERNLQEAKEALRQSEQHLWHAQKIDAIGRLAGGVAHDFNNLLTVIIGNCELLRDVPALDADARELIDMIHQSGNRAAELTRQLLAFSRKQRFVFKVMNLNSIIEKMNKLLRRLLGADIQLTTRFADALEHVRVDCGQIEQVILNLTVNAHDAMPTGGSLTIETFNLQLGADVAVGNTDIVPGRYAVLAVRDSGHGMNELTLRRIFEPFFTTKEQGKGTGLGLATVHGIVRQSGGHITVSSAVGEGTVFHIYLPAVDEPLASPKAEVVTLQPSRGTETILLAEDEDGVREFIRRTLAHHGYKVLTARDGVDALRVSDASADTIHLLISDKIMPRMAGPELIRQLRKQRPDLKVILISGYAEDSSLRLTTQHSTAAFLAKTVHGREADDADPRSAERRDGDGVNDCLTGRRMGNS